MPTTREYSATAYMNTKNRTSLSGKMGTRYAYCYVLGVYGYQQQAIRWQDQVQYGLRQTFDERRQLVDATYFKYGYGGSYDQNTTAVTMVATIIAQGPGYKSASGLMASMLIRRSY